LPMANTSSGFGVGRRGSCFGLGSRFGRPWVWDHLTLKTFQPAHNATPMTHFLHKT
jgi:hypothetical protein